ncbi:GHKL domain-containing protein [Mucilaginibacter sp. OK283]|jgi:sensor histidine kinase YesM|nr:GHKL domain-containing protein [Mucilaginibacter sp. OK283]
MDRYTDAQKNDQAINVLINTRYRLLRHIIFLLGLFFFIYSSDWSKEYGEAYRYFRLFDVYFGFVAMTYLNMYVLVPIFFFKGRYFIYMILLILMVFSTLVLVSYLLDAYFEASGIAKSLSDSDNIGLYAGTGVSIAIILVTTMMKLFGQWIKDKERITELNNLTLRMELNELRNQINPHFLFNMLNNVKALIRIDPEKATTVIMKLSEFLRYQLYENGEAKTSLLSELDFLSNLAELENIRRDKLSVTMEAAIPQGRLKNIFLPPNLFTTFLENAIKYSVDMTEEQEYIRINISVNDGNLYFKCRNSKGPDIWPADRKNSGLGLANIKRRLELLYKDDFMLKISSTDEEYFVDLIIPL